MKTTAAIVLIFVILILGNCKYSDEKNGKHDYSIVENDTLIRYYGNIFNSNEVNTLDFIYSKDGSPTILNFYADSGENKQLIFNDSAYTAGYYGDTLMDVNNDGTNELLIYQYTDMSRYKNLQLTCYRLNNSKVEIVDWFDTLSNVRFFPGKNYFTSLENLPQEKIARKFEWTGTDDFKLLEMILIDFSDNYDSCTTKLYKMDKLVFENDSCELDTIYGVNWESQ